MEIVLIAIFVFGYLGIIFEHNIHIDKAASALFIGMLGWTAFMMFGEGMVSNLSTYTDFVAKDPENNDFKHFVLHELSHYLSHSAEILFFLMGAMTIVELIDTHEGFSIITNKIKSTNKVVLLWIVCFITFFFSAALDNLTTSIVMISLLKKLVAEQKDRWVFAGFVIIAANSGGAWSPMGDVTTTMLWIGGQITALHVIVHLIIPSLVSVIVPLIIVSFTFKGEVRRPAGSAENQDDVLTSYKKNFVFFLGLTLLLSVPIFKSITHLPPYVGMLLALSILWIATEILHRGVEKEKKNKYSIVNVLRKIDLPSILFFLGILMAISTLQAPGILTELAETLRFTFEDVYTINIIIGFLSAIVDNVPLVAASMGMTPVYSPEMLAVLDPESATWFSNYVPDGKAWTFLAYCAGVGGSTLIIGSAAGVAVMGLEKIDFFWYLKKIGWLAAIGYLAGAFVYILLN